MKRLTTKEIMDVIDSHGDVTRATLADRLNSNKQTVRYHLRSLLRAGLIQVVRTTRTHASELKWYGRPRVSVPRSDSDDRLSQVLRASVELELCVLLDRWAKWTAERAPNPLMAEIDARITRLATHEQAALACEHKATAVWRFARIEQVTAYRSAINSLIDG